MAIRGNSSGMESDGSLMSGIPQGAVATCDECGHHGHFKIECKVCGCPSGIERKRERDAEHASAHGDSKRPAQGFY